MDPFDGTKFRRVRSLRVGEAGEVFLVEHRELGSHYAAKVLHPWLVDGKAAQRLRVEAQAIARLQEHPNIVRVFGFDRTCDGRPFIVFEYLKGETLAAAMAAGAEPPTLTALVLTWEILSALSAAHALGIVHRDIKPENLLLAEKADGTTSLKVLDFGIAKVLQDASPDAPRPPPPTTAGATLGGPQFISPEVAMGRSADHRSDLYATGMVLYTMLTGQHPFAHIENESMLLTAQAVEYPEAPSRLAKQRIRPELDAVVLRALEKDPEQRFQTAEEFMAALKPVIARLYHSSAATHTAEIPTSKAVRRERAEHDEHISAEDEARGSPPARHLATQPTSHVSPSERLGFLWTSLVVVAFAAAALISGSGVFAAVLLAARWL